MTKAAGDDEDVPESMTRVVDLVGVAMAVVGLATLVAWNVLHRWFPVFVGLGLDVALVAFLTMIEARTRGVSAWQAFRLSTRRAAKRRSG